MFVGNVYAQDLPNYKNEQLAPKERVNGLLRKLTVEEKIVFLVATWCKMTT
jgi:hypothetical protein